MTDRDSLNHLVLFFLSLSLDALALPFDFRVQAVGELLPDIQMFFVGGSDG